MSKRLFTKHVQKALEWINTVNNLLKWDRQTYALDALRAVLHQLRDNLPVIEAVHLGAQLPLVIRGIYFENWRPSQVPLKQRHKEMFIDSVRNNLEQYTRRTFECEDIEPIIRAVFQTLAFYIDEGESEKLLRLLPGDLKNFAAEGIYSL